MPSPPLFPLHRLPPTALHILGSTLDAHRSDLFLEEQKESKAAMVQAKTQVLSYLSWPELSLSIQIDISVTARIHIPTAATKLPVEACP